MDSQVNPVVSLVRERLDKHPHFRGRTDLIQILVERGLSRAFGTCPHVLP